MRKKLTLVALFCGALCLTGCLKTGEESQSVKDVRNSIANEHNSIAALNNAKAQAEIIYANAEATLKQAEAELKKAQAALILAQTETEKIRTELQKVNVKLAEAKLAEEQVELAKKQAELEKLLAEVEAAKAKAEADKQHWANVLAQAQADAAKAEINNALAILKAQEELEAYVLTLEAQKADSVKKYAGLYFAAQQKVSELQLQQIVIKAEKALVETGVKQAKKSINFEIDQINDKIAENEAIAKALAQKLTMDPKEAEAALKEARIELTDAYNDYMNAMDFSDAAWDAYYELDNMSADFTFGWPEFTNAIKAALPWDTYEIETGYGEVSFTGYWNEDDEFVPLYNREQEVWIPERYPDVEVYNPGDFMVLGHPVILPATIYYDNIEEAFEGVVDDYKAEMDEKVADFEEQLDADVEDVQEEIEFNNYYLNYHKKYVDSRKAKVEAAEKKFLAELEGKEKAEAARYAAWEDFQGYWLEKYDATRQLLIDRYNAEKAYNTAKADSDKKKEALEAKKATIANLTTAAATAKEAEIKAEAAYHLAEADVEGLTEAKTAAATKKAAYEAATKAVKPAKETMDKANTTLAEAEEYLARNPKGTANYDAAKKAYDAAKKAAEEATEAYNDAVEAEAKAKKDYEKAQAKVDEIEAPVKEAAKAWNPAIGSLQYVTKVSEAPCTYDSKNKQWVMGKEVAGTAQAAYLDALKAKEEAEADVKEGGKTYDAWATADAKTTAAKATFEAAEKALKDAIGAKNDETAAKKYEAYLAAEKEAAKAGTAWADLQKLYYAFITDDIEEVDYNWGNDIYTSYDEYRWVVGWLNSSFQVDYKATMLNSKGEEVLIASVLYPTAMIQDDYDLVTYVTYDGNAFDWDWDTEDVDEDVIRPGYSYSFQNKLNQQFIDSVEELKATAAEYADYLVGLKEAQVEEVLDAVNAHKATEASYLEWVDERMEAAEDAIDAEKAEFDAKQVYILAKAEYDALEAIANEGMWIYDPENDNANADGFVWITIKEEIEKLTGTTAVLNDCVLGLVNAAAASIDLSGNWKVNVSAAINKLVQYANTYNNSIVELNVVKKVLETVLKYSDVAEEKVLEMLDTQLEWNEEMIDIWTALAAKYKDIMNAYLGIVDGENGEEE